MVKKTLNKNFTAYSQDEIDNWKNLLHTIPSDIEKERIRLNQLNSSLAFYQDLLNNLQAQRLHPVETRLEKINAQIRYLKLPVEIDKLKQQVAGLEDQVSTEKKKLREVKDIIRIYQETIEKLQRHIEIKEIEDAIKSLVMQKERKENEMIGLPLALSNKKEAYCVLSNQIAHLEDKLVSLKEKELASNQQDSNLNHTVVEGSQYVSLPDSIPSNNLGYTSSISVNQQENSGYSSSISESHTSQADSNSLTGAPRVVHSLLPEINHLNEQIKALKEQQQLARQQKIELEQVIENNSDEIVLLDHKIKENEFKLQDFTYQEKRAANAEDLSGLQREVSRQVSEQIPYEQKKAKLESVLPRLEKQLSDYKKNLRSLNSDFDHYAERRGEFAENIDLDNLQQQVLQQEEIQGPLLEEKQLLNNHIKQHKNIIANTNHEINRLEKKLHALNDDEFMQKIWSQPDLLSQEMVTGTLSILDAFEEAHPAKQSDQVRLCIVELRDKLKAIQEIKIFEPMYNDYVSNLNALQTKFYQLCGLIWDQFNRLNQEKDYYLANALLAILSRHPIKEEFALGEFYKLNLQPILLSTVLAKEDQEYKAASKDFAELITSCQNATQKEQKNLYKSGKNLLNNISEKVPSIQPDTGELKYYTTILCTAKQLAEPHNENVKAKFKKLVHANEDGKPSLCKKIFGAALMFLSAVGSLASYFFLGPVGAIATACGGSVGLGAGFGLFRSGCSKGTDKALQDYERDANHVTFFAPAPSAPPIDADTLMQNNPKEGNQLQKENLLYPDLQPLYKAWG